MTGANRRRPLRVVPGAGSTRSWAPMLLWLLTVWLAMPWLRPSKSWPSTQRTAKPTFLGLILLHAGHANEALLGIERALANDPTYPLGLWAKGITLFEGKQDYAGAIETWETLMAQQLSAVDADRVAQMLTEARKRLAAQASRPGQSARSQGTITGTVSVAASLRAEAPTNGALFIIARKGDGPPLAVKRIPNPTFPVAFSLGPEPS